MMVLMTMVAKNQVMRQLITVIVRVDIGDVHVMVIFAYLQICGFYIIRIIIIIIVSQ